MEFLREMGTDAARSYLQAVPGVGTKSAGCILLLCLMRDDFPIGAKLLQPHVTQYYLCSLNSLSRTH